MYHLHYASKGLWIDCPHQLIADLFLVLCSRIEFVFSCSFCRVVTIFIPVKTESPGSSSSGHRFIVYRFHLIHLLKMSSRTKKEKNDTLSTFHDTLFSLQFDSQSELNVSSIKITSFFPAGHSKFNRKNDISEIIACWTEIPPPKIKYHNVIFWNETDHTIANEVWFIFVMANGKDKISINLVSEMQFSMWHENPLKTTVEFANCTYFCVIYWQKLEIKPTVVASFFASIHLVRVKWRFELFICCRVHMLCNESCALIYPMKLTTNSLFTLEIFHTHAQSI